MNTPDNLRYLPPHEQPTANKTASERAKTQASLAETLRDQRRTGENTMKNKGKLVQGGIMPSAFTTNTAGKTEITSAIERDASVYQHVFNDAEHTAKEMCLRYEFFYGPLSPEQKALIQCMSIQNAINTHIRPDQKQAETNMEQLTEENYEQGAAIIDLHEIKNHQAEVCTTKSLIARHYLQEHCPEVTVTPAVTTPTDGTDGHAYLELSGALNSAFHPNSPIRSIDGSYLPFLTHSNDQQRRFLLDMQKHQRDLQAA